MRFLCAALLIAQGVARVAQANFERLERLLVVFKARLHVGECCVVLLECRFGFRTDGTLLFDLRANLFQFAVDLATARVVALHCLRQLEHVHLQHVHAARGLLGAGAHLRERLAGLAVRRFSAHGSALGFVRQQHLRTHLLLQVLDFLGAGQHTGLFGIGRVQLHR